MLQAKNAIRGMVKVAVDLLFVPHTAYGVKTHCNGLVSLVSVWHPRLGHVDYIDWLRVMDAHLLDPAFYTMFGIPCPSQEELAQVI